MFRRSGTPWRSCILAPVALLVLAACDEAAPVSDASVAPAAKAVRVEQVAPRPVTPSFTVPGVVEAEARISLAFRVSGYVARFHVDEGDAVETGRVLAELDPQDLERELRAARAALARARAHAEDARRGHDRQEELLARSATSAQRFERARSEAEMAQAELGEARVRAEAAAENLARATLRAPVSGRVEARWLEPHELATAGQTVLVVVDLDPATVRAAVPDARVPDLRPGGPARVRAALAPGHVFEGRIAHVAVAADPASRTVPFEVAVPNPDGVLRPEAVVEVEVPVGVPEPLRLVPLSAVLRDVETRPFCFVAAGRGDALRAERRPVEIGALYGERVAIRAGLADGERVVVRGQHFLRAGDRLRIVED